MFDGTLVFVKANAITLNMEIMIPCIAFEVKNRNGGQAVLKLDQTINFRIFKLIKKDR